MIRNARLLLALAAVTAISVSACGDNSTKVNAGSPGGTSATPPAGCAAADGSSARQDKFTAYPPMCITTGTTYTAVVETSKGTLHIKLRNDIAPKTANSFVNLARFHYFDATTCHRAIKGFVVQCGDPTATGTGGPGYEFEDELSKIEPYRVGSVAMANSGPNTNGSQFFIITGDQGTALPPQYTLFGQVLDSDLPVVAALDAVANPSDGPPLQPINITKISIQAG